VSDWELLPDALQRVIATTGMTRDAAAEAICVGLSNGKIKRRVLVGEFDGYGFPQLDRSTLWEADVKIPAVIETSAIDWRESRARRAWPLNQGGYPPHGAFAEIIQVCRSDVDGLFPTPTRTIKDETGAIEYLARLGKEKVDNLTKTAALELCRKAGFNISDRGEIRVMRTARLKVGLPESGRPGRRPSR
jgi:hypothetical protein